MKALVYRYEYRNLLSLRILLKLLHYGARRWLLVETIMSIAEIVTRSSLGLSLNHVEAQYLIKFLLYARRPLETALVVSRHCPPRT